MKKIINTSNAPKAIGPYSQAVEVNGMLFISGQLPINPATGKFAEGGIKEQTEQALKNIGAILTEAGYSFDNVVKST
ncbi:MAG: Rid family hydrolase, partial [Bacteroidales bacterium]